MEFEEGLAKAGGEGWGGFGDATLRTRKFRRKAREEIVLGLFRSQNRNRGQNAKGVRGKEDNVFRGWAMGNRLDDIFDVVNWIGNAGIFRDGFIGKINLAVCIDRDVF